MIKVNCKSFTVIFKVQSSKGLVAFPLVSISSLIVNILGVILSVHCLTVAVIYKILSAIFPTLFLGTFFILPMNVYLDTVIYIIIHKIISVIKYLNSNSTKKGRVAFPSSVLSDLSITPVSPVGKHMLNLFHIICSSNT